MKRRLAMWIAMVAAGLIGLATYAQEQKKEEKVVTLKSALLEQLRSTHNKKDWFVDGNTAISGLTPEQASWKDGKGNHSVGQLTYHLVFWNQRTLARLKGEAAAKFSGNNEETFDTFDAKRWNDTVRQFDEVMTELEKLVESADDAQIKTWATDLEHIGAHNAYHIGEIVYVRREQGSWDPKKGVS